MDIFYLKEENLFNFLKTLESEYEVFVPQKSEGKLRLCPFGFEVSHTEYILKEISSVDKENFSYNPYRTIEPLKSFFISTREPITEYFESAFEREQKPRVIFGMKNCDLFSLKIQDFVFLEGVVKDPFYERRRHQNILISSDCFLFKEVCFCTALGIMPYAQEGFDLNFSEVTSGYIVEVGSEKGAKVIQNNYRYFNPATPVQIASCNKKREKFVSNLNQHLILHDLVPKEIIPQIVKEGFNSGVWQELVLNCVECGGCNFICDTCHCFLLSDERFGKINEKIRSWDACLYANFAKVAGGANPLRYRYQRLRNRYLKKFDFFVENLGLLACCGCGRCIEVCPAKIDIREVLKKLAQQYKTQKI
ncbi:MAG: 4Fe-4S dicluster domain-containing protein [Candidatus Omnitrophica bacterium]|nr:4Fe-4S dicluster domain-containing protein [Candidatus Omnitrophota bacterium]